MDWRTCDQISNAGRPINEDACGTAGSLAWIADGAGTAGPPRFHRHGTDAAWLVHHVGQFFDRTIYEHDPETPLTQALGLLEAYLDLEWGARSVHDPAGGPTCCLAVAELRGRGEADIAVLGDVVALVPCDDGQLRVFTDDRVKPFEALSLAALGEAPRGDSAMPPAARAQIQANRALMNTAQGFPLVCPLAKWSKHVKRETFRLAHGTPLVLITDGFYRLVDVFGLYTDDTLYEACAAGAGKQLLAQLRAAEDADEDMSRFRRFKVHDDATLLIVSPV